MLLSSGLLYPATPLVSTFLLPDDGKHMPDDLVAALRCLRKKRFEVGCGASVHSVGEHAQQQERDPIHECDEPRAGPLHLHRITAELRNEVLVTRVSPSRKKQVSGKDSTRNDSESGGAVGERSLEELWIARNDSEIGEWYPAQFKTGGSGIQIVLEHLPGDDDVANIKLVIESAGNPGEDDSTRFKCVNEVLSCHGRHRLSDTGPGNNDLALCEAPD